jgi:hypothetical protein
LVSVPLLPGAQCGKHRPRMRKFNLNRTSAIRGPDR